jgi:glycerophosphoryl diester phosphodiesterase
MPFVSENCREQGGAEILKVLFTGLEEFRANFKSFLTYEILFKILSLVVLGPIFVVSGAYFISFTGHSSVSNERLAAYFLSVPGAVSVLLWGIASLSVLFTEFAGLLLIAYSSMRGRSVPGGRALVFSLKSIPDVIGLGAVQFLVWAGCCLPFVVCAGLTYLGLLTEHDISFYPARRPPAFRLAVVIGLVLAAACLGITFHLLISWFYALPVRIFERRTARRALSESRDRVKGSYWRIAGILVSAPAIFLALTAACTLIVSLIAQMAGYGLGTLLKKPPAAAVIVPAVNYGAAALFSIMAFPWFGSLIARLYRDRCTELTLPLPALPEDGKEDRPGETIPARALTWGVVVLIFALTGVIAVAVHEDLQREDKVQVTAHRGSSAKAPENTLSAIRRAVDDGADFAEIDVQETADGVIVVLHDSDLMRIAGVNKKIWETPFAEIRTMDAGSRFSKQFAGEPIPTLEQAIDSARGKIKLNIELKFNGHEKRLAERAVEIITGRKFEENCIVTSLNYEGLLRVRKLNNRIKTGHIVAKAVGDITARDVDLLSVESRLATFRLIRKSHGKNKQVHVWTVNKPARMDYFVDMRVDNIITDHPDVLVELLRKRVGMNDAERIRRKMTNWLR